MENNFSSTENSNGINNNGTSDNMSLPPKNYLVESILVTILCCLPFGIAGIINASKVEGLFRTGDIEGAQRASAEAKKYCKWALIGGGIVAVLLIIYYVVIFAYIASSGNF